MPRLARLLVVLVAHQAIVVHSLRDVSSDCGAKDVCVLAGYTSPPTNAQEELGRQYAQLACHYAQEHDGVTVPNVGVNTDATAGNEVGYSAFLEIMKKPATVIGPLFSEAAQFAHIGARKSEVPMLLVDSTNQWLTGLDYTMRLGPSSLTYADAAVQLLEYYSWKQFALVSSNDAHGRGFAEAVMDGVTNVDRLSVTTHAQFIPATVNVTSSNAEITNALHRVQESGSRIVVLSAHPTDVVDVLAVAQAMGMTGKGWTWIASEWASMLTFSEQNMISVDASTASSHGGGHRRRRLSSSEPHTATSSSITSGHDLLTSMEGLIGFVPDNSGAAWTSQLSGWEAPCTVGSTALSGALNAPNLVYLYDALTIATAGDGVSCTQPPGTCKAQSSPTSAATGEPIAFDAHGQRTGVRLNLVNLVGGKFNTVGSYASTSVPTEGDALSQTATGTFTPPANGLVTWPGDTTEIPSSIALAHVNTMAQYMTLVMVGLSFSFIAEALLHKHHIQKLPGSGATILCGAIFGGLLKSGGNHHLIEGAEFDEHIFTLILLPIIIFESGYALKRSFFFNQLGSIILFAIVGTCIATFFTGGILFKWANHGLGLHNMSLEECLAFAALISAVDPVATLATFGALKVDPKLNALVYGESVINDAMAIVLYRSFIVFFYEPVSGAAIGSAIGVFFSLSIGSLLIGILVTIITSLMLKHFPLFENYNLEALVILTMSYAAFAFAEMFHFSGIVSSLVAGICMNHFTAPNLSKAGKLMTSQLLSLMSMLADTIIFFLVGVNVALFSESFNWTFTFFTLFLCLVGRALNVFPLAWILNMTGRSNDPISPGFQIVMWHSGLRGAIAYALAIGFPSHNRELIVSCTSVIILFTVFCLGGSSTSLLNYFQIQMGVEVTHDVNVETVNNSRKSSALKALWLDFSRNSLAPCLIKREALEDSTHDVHSSEDGTGDRANQSWRSGGGGDGTFLAPVSADVSDAQYTRMDDDIDHGEL